MSQALGFAASATAFTPNLSGWDFVDVLGIPYVHLPPLRIRALNEGWTWGVTVWEAWWNYAYLQPPFASASVQAFRVLLGLGVRGRHPVVVGSRLTADALVLRFAVDPRRIRLNPPAVDRELIATVPRAVSAFDVLYVGRLEPHKRVADLIEAVAQLRSRGVRLRLGIIGIGPERPGLEALANARGVRDDVDFLGEVAERTKFGLLKSARLFVLPSEREGFSIATLESMACGTPFVVARPANGEQFGVGELLPPESSELTYPAGNVPALAERIGGWLSDDDRLKRMGEALERRTQAYDLRGLSARDVAGVRGVS
jgi:glycosyltransferase involved in cell wall biosynthesis